jgi:hypothetical protein
MVRKSRQALAQGPHRFARGQKFFNLAQHQSAELKAAFGWRLEFVPGEGHDPRKMSGPAAAILMRQTLSGSLSGEPDARRKVQPVASPSQK